MSENTAQNNYKDAIRQFCEEKKPHKNYPEYQKAIKILNRYLTKHLVDEIEAEFKNHPLDK